MYMWFVNWIDKYFVRPRRILRRVIRLTYNIGKMVYFKTRLIIEEIKELRSIDWPLFFRMNLEIFLIFLFAFFVLHIDCN
jgi:hypothetical protein